MQNDGAMASMDDAGSPIGDVGEVLFALAWHCDDDGLYPMCDVPSREGCVKEWSDREAARFPRETKMLAPAKRHVCDCMCHDSR